MCWIFFAADTGDMLLASGAQDNYIRMWRISSRDQCLSGDVTTSDLKLKEDCFTVISAGRFPFHSFTAFLLSVFYHWWLTDRKGISTVVVLCITVYVWGVDGHKNQ